MTELTNRQAIGVLDGLWSNPLFGNSHRQAFEIGIMAIKALEQEPFINKLCVSNGVCEHDKNKVLKELKKEVESKYDDFANSYDERTLGKNEMIEGVLEMIDELMERSDKE